jgi:glutathione synthase/RimK-type ligase-like ATP-grasp enzyme
MLVDWINPTITAAIELLRRRGKQIELIRPEKQTLDLSTVRVQNDLYVTKSGTALALSLAGTLYGLGAKTLNPYPTVMLLKDKIIVTRLLQQAGIPTPETHVTSEPKELAPLPERGTADSQALPGIARERDSGCFERR